MSEYNHSDLFYLLVGSDPGNGLLLVDENGTIVFLNRAAEVILGTGWEHLVGTPASTLYNTRNDEADVPVGSPDPEGTVVDSGTGSTIPSSRLGRRLDDITVSTERFGSGYYLLTLERDAVPAGSDRGTGDCSPADEHRGDAVLVVDAETGTINGYDQAAVDLLSPGRERFDSKTIQELAGDGHNWFESLVETVTGGELGWTRERLMPAADNRPGIVLYATGIELGNQSFVIFSLRTADEGVMSEQVAEKTTVFTTLLKRTNDVVLLYDPDQDAFLDCNERASELLGYPRRELLSLDATDVFARDSDRFEAVIKKARATGSSHVNAIECIAATGEHIQLAGTLTAVDDADDKVLLVLGERRGKYETDPSRKGRTEQLLALFENTSDSIVGLERNDGEWKIVEANTAFEETFGVDHRSNDVRSVIPLDSIRDAAGLGSFDELVSNKNDIEIEISSKIDNRKYTFIVRVISPADTEDRCFLLFTDITDRIQYQDRLERLNGVNQDLMQARTEAEIADIGLSTVEDVFGFKMSAIRSYDPETNEFSFVGMTDAARSLIQSKTVYQLDRTHAGRAYRKNELVRNRETVTDTETDTQTEYVHLHIPLGDRGVLSIVTEDTAEFEETMVQSINLLATSVITAYERVQRETELRESREQLQDQKETFQRFNRIHELIRLVVRRLTDVNTRAELEQVVCDELAASEFYDSAWIGEMDRENHIEPRASAGVDEDMIEAFGSMTLDQLEGGIISRALDEQDIRVIEQVSMEPDHEVGTDREVRDDQLESTAAVPIIYKKRQYGVLIVKSDQSDVFEDTAQRGLKILGEIIGFAINSIRNRSLLQSDSVIELEFEITDPTSIPVAVSKTLNCRCEITGITPAEDGSVVCYLKIDHPSCARISDQIQSMEGVSDVRVIEKTESMCRIEFVKTSTSAEQLHRFGARTTGAVAEGGKARVTAVAPPEADIRDIVETYRTLYPEATLVSKRRRDRDRRTESTLHRVFNEQLTDKQARAIEAAYRAGYYEWPRQSTAEDVAKSLDISSSTFHQHMRSAYHRLFDEIFSEEDVSGDVDDERPDD